MIARSQNSLTEHFSLADWANKCVRQLLNGKLAIVIVTQVSAFFL